jgi:hypothetical protein
MTDWPRDNQRELIAFYGDPGKGEVARQLVKVTPPFQMYYDGRPLKTISFHKKAAPALIAALNEIWEACGKDQSVLDREGISDCAGTYNPRKVRGSATKWSNHAFGAAIDLDAKSNGLGTKGDMPSWVVAAFKRQGARWGGDYRGRKDPMHFEFCRDANADAVGLIDLPHGDADTDDPIIPDVPPPHDVAPDAPIPQPWWKRAWTWVSGGGFSLGSIGAALYDWRVAAIIVAALLIVFIVAWPTIKRKLEAA